MKLYMLLIAGECYRASGLVKITRAEADDVQPTQREEYLSTELRWADVKVEIAEGPDQDHRVLFA